MSITLVAGLGNPGRGYARTRHNLGWWVVDALAAKHQLSWKQEPAFEAHVARWDVRPGLTRWLMKPQTFMNESGRSVAKMAGYFKLAPSAVAVVYDDLGLDVGRIKVSVNGSAGGHNGIASLLEHLGDDFNRFRLGIGPKSPGEMDLKDFVLSAFSPEQLAIIEQKIDHYVQGLDLLLERGAAEAMNQLNRKETPSP